jgi:hypothetical protein
VVHGEPVMNNIMTNTNFTKLNAGLKIYTNFITFLEKLQII